MLKLQTPERKTAGLATPHRPDTVAVERLEPGKYRVVIRSKKGIAQAYLGISDSL